MRTYDITDKDGRLLAFEIANAGLGRRRATRVLFGVPGCRPIRRPKVLSWFREDSFCEAEIDGVRFEIEEPFGDSSRYWVGPNPPEVVPQTASVRHAFEQVPEWKRWARIVLFVVVLAAAAAARLAGR